MGCGSCSGKKNVNQTFENLVPKFDKKSGYKNLKGFKNDSLGYLRENFIANKQYYTKKKLGVLLNNLELPIENYYVSLSNDPTLSDGIMIVFDDKKAFLSNKKMGKYVLLNISWETLLDEKIVFDLVRSSKTKWTNEVNDFYKDKVVKDINMVTKSQ